jgi:hypothetical protein
MSFESRLEAHLVRTISQLLEDYGSWKPVKIVTGHRAWGEFLSQCDDGYEGYIDRVKEIPSPYMYSPTEVVFKWKGKNVFAHETRHRRHEVFEVPAGIEIRKEE